MPAASALGVPRRHEERVDAVHGVLGRAARVREDARGPARHALEPDEAEALEEGGVDHDVHRREELRRDLVPRQRLRGALCRNRGASGGTAACPKRTISTSGRSAISASAGRRNAHPAPLVLPEHRRDAHGRGRRPVPARVVDVGVRADRDGVAAWPCRVSISRAIQRRDRDDARDEVVRLARRTRASRTRTSPRSPGRSRPSGSRGTPRPRPRGRPSGSRWRRGASRAGSARGTRPCESRRGRKKSSISISGGTVSRTTTPARTPWRTSAFASSRTSATPP